MILFRRVSGPTLIGENRLGKKLLPLRLNCYSFSNSQVSIRESFRSIRRKLLTRPCTCGWDSMLLRVDKNRNNKEHRCSPSKVALWSAGVGERVEIDTHEGRAVPHATHTFVPNFRTKA